MKAEIKVIQEVEIKYLKMVIPVDDECDFPLVKNGMLELVIDIDTGKLSLGDFKLDKYYEIFEKVVDSGCYYLYDQYNKDVLKIENDYVPNNLIPGEYGDYVDLKIDKNGYIINWYSGPSIKDFIKDDEE